MSEFFQAFSVIIAIASGIAAFATSISLFDVASWEFRSRLVALLGLVFVCATAVGIAAVLT